MKINNLPKELIIAKDEKEEIIDRIIKKFSHSNQIHYLWSKLYDNEFKTQIKIKADNSFYKKLKEININYKRKCFLLIDKECLQCKTEHQLLYVSIEELLNILIENYWELDEIYVFDMDYNWIISVNHMFEIVFVGNQLSELVSKINSVSDIDKCIVRKG